MRGESIERREQSGEGRMKRVGITDTRPLLTVISTGDLRAICSRVCLPGYITVSAIKDKGRRERKIGKEGVD